MRTTITLRDDLLKLARSYARGQSITGAINRALDDWARRLRVERVKSFSGTVAFEKDWRQLRRLETEKARRRHGSHTG